MKTMKTKHLLLMSLVLTLTALTAMPQDIVDKTDSAKENIPFGKKLPPPDLPIYPDRSLQQVTPATTVTNGTEIKTSTLVKQ